MYFVCLLAKQHTTVKWNSVISVFPVIQGSADTLVRWSGKLPTFCEIFLPKITKFQLCILELQLKMSWILLCETQCISTLAIIMLVIIHHSDMATRVTNFSLTRVDMEVPNILTIYRNRWHVRIGPTWQWYATCSNENKKFTDTTPSHSIKRILPAVECRVTFSNTIFFTSPILGHNVQTWHHP